MVRNTALNLSLFALLSFSLTPAQASDTSASGDQDCIDASDCESSEAQAATDSQRITLFTPGQYDSEWLKSDHPGAQSLRQGERCAQCHQGEERNMGENIAERGQTASRDMDISFAVVQDSLQVTLSWQGSTNDQRVALMWGNGGNAAFRRTGCWASCHSDMTGMSGNSGQPQGKYLRVARAGQGASYKSAAELQALRAAGDFVEIWHATAQGKDEATARGGLVLEQLHWYERHPISAEANYDKGRWQVTFSRPLRGGPGGSKSFMPSRDYNFGVALQGSQEDARAHWVSLPMSFSLDREQTDFTAAPK